ncbi:MAG: hypothetical protein Q7W55_10935 [Pseudohongiella sp.]|nr:hypothetical protein [Pseudohongiella sp.]
MSADKLLARLDKVKQNGTDRWLACCPAHVDRSPSLTIKQTDDGTVLVKCWSGCGAADIVQAVGLSLKDLFPDRPHFRTPMRPGERWVPRDVIAALAHELLTSVMYCSAMAAGKQLTQDDSERLTLAASRLYAAWLEVSK